MKALIISADNFEDSELLVPFRLKEEGVKVKVPVPANMVIASVPVIKTKAVVPLVQNKAAAPAKVQETKAPAKTKKPATGMK